MPVLFNPQAAGDILSAMITPAVLISACGTLVLSTTNRLGRIVDRVRKLNEDAETLPAWDPADEDAQAKRALIAGQIAHQGLRIGGLQWAVITLYTAIGLLVGCSLTIGLSAASNGWLVWVPVGMGLLGASALLGRRCSWSGTPDWRSGRRWPRWSTSSGWSPGGPGPRCRRRRNRRRRPRRPPIRSPPRPRRPGR